MQLAVGFEEASTRKSDKIPVAFCPAEMGKDGFTKLVEKSKECEWTVCKWTFG
jgi:hypothetical protein